MRRFAQLLALLLAFSLTLPALAAGECGELFAIARLNASGSGTATGRAVVIFDGGVQTVTFTSTIVSDSDVEQTWHFAEGTVEVTEHPMPVLLAGPWQLIDSDVDVDSPEGNWHYDGLFNENSLRATFIVTGALCFS